jgi:hypothetical protein
MKKKWAVSIFSVFGFSILAFFGTYKYFQELPKKNDPNFKEIAITKWTAGECPCIPIQIEEKTISSKIDLGFRGYFSIDSSFLEQIKEKTAISTQIMYGFQGHEYKKNVFKIPEIQISGQIFLSNEVHEEAKDFNRHGTFVNDGSSPSLPEPVRLGWKLFQNTNLLLDFRKNKIAFCDCLSTLGKNGYSIKDFTVTPLITERGLIELDIQTTNKPLRCVLDTGCTWSLLNTENIEEKSIDELVWNPENFHEMACFKINEMKFGPITFRQLPIQLPIHIEAILGMDFLSQNTVFIDFSHNLVYLSR